VFLRWFNAFAGFSQLRKQNKKNERKFIENFLKFVARARSGGGKGRDEALERFWDKFVIVIETLDQLWRWYNDLKMKREST
jgi:predicted ABC-type exoprotein transport system permease subunit